MPHSFLTPIDFFSTIFLSVTWSGDFSFCSDFSHLSMAGVGYMEGHEKAGADGLKGDGREGTSCQQNEEQRQDFIER